MSGHGAALQTCNQELVKCLEELKIRRIELKGLIDKEETEKKEIEQHIKSLQTKLTLVTGKLANYSNLHEHYEKTIKETENGFKKILESSQALLQVAQHESSKLDDYTHKKQCS